MKHNILALTLAGLGLMASVSASAKDVYVYSTTGNEMGRTDNVKQIVFDNGKITIVPHSGEKADYSLADVGCVSFKYLGLNGISAPEAAGITAALNGGTLSVTSDSVISEIRVYNTAGSLTGYCAPSACRATMKIDTRGVSFVVVNGDGVSRTFKIAR